MERFVDLGGRRLRMACLGEGEPTVILEAGMGQPLETWRLVQPAVAEWARVVSYDRAGVGQSDPRPTPRSCLDIVSDLQALLEGARIPPPYVLVGHSLGGLVVRAHAQRFPEDVVGMVLVDAPHPAYPARALEVLPPEATGECAEVTESRRTFARMVQGTDDPDGPEAVAWGASLAQVLAAGPLGERPLVVVSAGKPGDFAPDFPADLAVEITALVRECQRDLVRLSPKGKHLVAEASGHFVQLDQPELVVDAVRTVVEAVRNLNG